MNDLERAKDVARKAHSDQGYAGRPYSYHLEQVERVLRDHGFDDEAMLTAAWLHDVVEDSPWTRDRVEGGFGTEVADLVWRVTDAEGRGRREKKLATYPKIAESERAVALKVADRIANVRECAENGTDRYLEMYRREHEEFRRHLHAGTWEGMWQQLDDLVGYETS